MKSNKQRRTELKKKRADKRAAAEGNARRLARERDVREWLAAGAVPVNADSLAKYNSYSHPVFVERGYYLDLPFACAGCGSEEIWTAAQQKWWYEIAKGPVYSIAKLCRNCRRKKHAPRSHTCQA